MLVTLGNCSIDISSRIVLTCGCLCCERLGEKMMMQRWLLNVLDVHLWVVDEAVV